MSIFVSGALVLAKQHFTIGIFVCKIMYFQELFIWLAPEHQLSQLIDAQEHQFWSRCFMSIFISGALVLAKQHFTTVKKVCKIMYFQELFIWLAQEHQLQQLIDAPGKFCWLLGAFWAPMVDLGGSWRKYMKTIVLLYKTYTFHSPGLFFGCPKSYILDH